MTFNEVMFCPTQLDQPNSKYVAKVKSLKELKIDRNQKIVTCLFTIYQLCMEALTRLKVDTSKFKKEAIILSDSLPCSWPYRLKNRRYRSIAPF